MDTVVAAVSSDMGHRDQSTSEMAAAFQHMHTLSRDDVPADQALRRDRLIRLEKALERHTNQLVAAMSSDFSHRALAECRNFDITMPLAEIRHARRNLKRWMRVRRARSPIHLFPASGGLLPQPLGVVGIIAPWNFPIFLTLGPAATALAAGNRVMIKSSELTPRTSAALAEMIGSAFAPDEMLVVTGNADVAAQFAELPFDHLLFTGSTRVGRMVAAAAARNLTPVTLELGGKSPAIITPSADLDLAARRIAWGKTANAGQICIAPDYVLVPRGQLDSLVEKLMAAIATLYPEGAASADYTAIISGRHSQRLEELVAEADDQGVQIIRGQSGSVLPGQRKMAPVIVVDPPDHLRLMREEIFGPILPVIPYDNAEEALALVNGRDRPLALYVFAADRADRAFWLSRTVSGGVTVNDTLIHAVFNSLPFGGVGASGIGAYHGDRGFETFSHMKPVVTQARLNGTFLMEAPFGWFKRRMLDLLRRMV